MPATTRAIEKGWSRADMPPWEARWAALAASDRLMFVKKVRIPPAHYTRLLPNPILSFPWATRQAWEQAGLIVAADAKNFVVAPDARDFATRLDTLKQSRALDPQRPTRLHPYLDVAFHTFQLTQVFARIVQHASGLGQYRIEGDPISTFVARRVWPDWVADYLDNPLARPLLAAIEQAGRPVLLSRIADLLPGHHPDAVRTALDLLVTHVAVVEDLDANTADILVGLLPEVAALRQKPEAQSAQLQPAVAREVGPEGGVIVPDLRAFLLEVATIPPKLKQDGSLFQKEEARFRNALDPLPDWFLAMDREDAIYNRLNDAHRWALRMEFAAAPKRKAAESLLRLTEEGQRWLTLDREAQFAALAAFLRDDNSQGMYWGWNDHGFLASAATAVLHRKNSRAEYAHHYGVMPAAEKQALRDALHQLFAELPVGTFHRKADVIARGCEPIRNPLMLRRSLREVVIRVGHRQLPPFEEAVVEAGKKLLDDFIRERLAPMGAVQLGVDEMGQLLLARLPRLDVYFGKAAAAAPAVSAETRVLVQPDFTIVVIGLEAAPAAELAPFCDRQRGSSSHGSLTFRLSRESVLRGMAAGIGAEEMLERLRRLASKPVPENVATELREWAGQARTVTVRTAVLFECPDGETAGRVQQALGKRAERVGESGVAWPAEEKLTGSLRKKLQDQGIFVEGATARPGKKKR